ncbi:uncharacterized protein LOC118415415 [Branchiostoma floridae]|uniref:RING-type E3 ubiquitin transferase n=1 Tax=Branchiostoma floridae TaxID=7739 RepID=A0A9J7L5M0_BRAFL|nr:uncharacterized protein LOC118415415 [Branchiostoma floridae]
MTMALRSGWDTIFAEPIRWKRNQMMKECWDHIKYTMVVAVSIMVFLWFTQVHRYLYNAMYGPFVLSEQEIVDTTRGNLWKQYVQVHHGIPLRLKTKEVGCGMDICKPMIFQFKKHAAHDSNINQLVVKRPLRYSHRSYSVRHPINFSVMSVKKLMAIIRAIGMGRYVLPGMEKSDLVSIISKAYDSNPKEFNLATESHVLVGFLTDFVLGVLSVTREPEYMDLVLNTSDPYVTIFSILGLCAILYAYFVMKIVCYALKIAQIWAFFSRLFTSFGSTEIQKLILEPIKHIAPSEGPRENTSLSVYDLVALKLQEEILSDEVSTIVNEAHFRLFVTNRHVIYVRNDVVDVVSVSTIDEIRTWGHTCDIVLSSGQLRILHMSQEQAGHMKNVLSSRCARFRQLQEERRVRRQQAEQEARRRREQEELTRRHREQEEVTRRHREQEEEIRRHREHEEAIRRINAFLASLAERAGERPATEEAAEEMRQSAFILELDTEQNCVICQEDMKEGERVIKFPCPARHQYHEDCLLQWLHVSSWI